MEILQKIGLTKIESNVYKTLLRLNEVPIAKIIKDTGAHPQVIYRAIDTLTEKGLILNSVRGGKKHVRAENPDILEEIVEKQLKDVRAVLPSLHALTHATDQAIVRVIRGKEAVANMRMNALQTMKPGETFYIIGGSGTNYYEIMGKKRKQWDTKRIEKKIKKKLLSFESQKKSINNNEKKNQLNKLAEYRYLPGEYPIPSSTNIFKNTTAIIIWSSDPIIIQIESPEVTTSYKHHFNELWKIANK